ncbi:MAG: SEC-C metal-binding domain-containing protein [Blautia sp.]|uniref:YecA family protein n=1 Tax=Blautia sp. TaxID=1955243 RepID=UPI002E7620FF|nr:SEC-C metal-binding domain-containing protein [Blautia sp.]MEE1445023.1 SEC-C metal-binding domain-containing protein [Blautia sp.]
MLLREYLTEYTKEELLDQARSFEIRKCSGLRKADLIDTIVDTFCTEEMLRSRLACLTKEQMDLFRKACISPTAVSVNEVVDAMKLYRYWIGYFEEPTDRFCVFEDVAVAFSKVDDESFRRKQCRKGWMVKCIHFFIQYYGIAPIEVIYEMYRQKVKCSIDEMIEMLWEMPVDIVESCLFTMDRIGMKGWPKENPLYSEKGIFVHLQLFEDEEFDYLLRQQKDKDFYIPSAQQIDEICRIGYEASSSEYKKLESFFIKKLRLPYEQAVTWCLQVWANSYEGESPLKIINKMTEANIEFEEKMINELLELVMAAHNNTRMKENRGYKPSEMARKMPIDKMPTIVPASSKAAAILMDAAPQLQAMGVPVDLNGNTDVIHTTMFPRGLSEEPIRVEKKIYPNDPCPCGSGKKYKKCCGKKNGC